MATYTASDFCQGHGGGRECTYDIDYGYCLHGDDVDHGTVSYCDGTCTEGREHYSRHLRVELGREPELSTTVITLDVWGPHLSYQVSFEGSDAEAWALAYMAARPSVHFSDVYDRLFSYAAFPALAGVLHPTCAHSMSADLCEGPNHYMTREQEIARGW